MLTCLVTLKEGLRYVLEAILVNIERRRTIDYSHEETSLV